MLQNEIARSFNDTWNIEFGREDSGGVFQSSHVLLISILHMSSKKAYKIILKHYFMGFSQDPAGSLLRSFLCCSNKVSLSASHDWWKKRTPSFRNMMSWISQKRTVSFRSIKLQVNHRFFTKSARVTSGEVFKCSNELPLSALHNWKKKNTKPATSFRSIISWTFHKFWSGFF